MIKSAYIHIPFCKQICSYCDFCKLFYHEKWVDQYLDALEEEIHSIYQGEVLDTIYIGGGTPSCLSFDQLKKLFQILKHFKMSKNIEFSIECNFDSITKEKLILFKKYGVNRLSFGLESIHDGNLDLLNRKESKEKVVSILRLSREFGFSNINVDLMYAIPGEDLTILEQDIHFLLSLDLEHISTYSLMIEEHTKLGIDTTCTIAEDLDFSMYQLICSKLKNKYDHYEISNFAKEGYQSRHNMCYWMNQEYYGFGLSAASYIKNKRITNTRSITKYLKKEIISDYEKLTISDKMDYEMILGLRLKQGVSKQLFYDTYGKSIAEVYPIDQLLAEGFLSECGDFLKIPEDKLYISNEILVHFIKE